MKVSTLLTSCLMAVSLSVSASVTPMAEVSEAAAHDKAVEAASVIEFFMNDDNHAIPDSLLSKATCVMTVTDMVKVAFIFGARGGWGLASCRTGNGWSPAAYYQLSGANWGFQAGLQKIDVVLVFTNEDAVEVLSKGRLNLGAGLAVTVGPVGRGLEAGTDYRLDSAVYSYSRAKGVYAGLSLEGSMIVPKAKYNEIVYPDMTPAEILTSSRGLSISTVEPYVSVLEAYAR